MSHRGLRCGAMTECMKMVRKKEKKILQQEDLLLCGTIHQLVYKKKISCNFHVNEYNFPLLTGLFNAS